MRKCIPVVFVVCILSLTYASPLLISESLAADDMKSQFLGSWSLVSWTDTDEQGEAISPYGDDAFGRIVYLENGRMMVVLMRQGRGALQDADFFSYSGTFDIDEVAGTVTHHIEACIQPSWIGGDRVRTFEMEGSNRIALRPVEGNGELVWQREE